MQWIKTLIMFLALFLGSDALCAKSQSPVLTKHTPTTHSPAHVSTISRHTPSQVILCTNQNNSFLVNSNGPSQQHARNNKQRQNTKYRCGRKRWKKFHPQDLTPISQHNQSILELKNIKPPRPEQYSTRLPDAVVISMHQLSNVIEPLE